MRLWPPLVQTRSAVYDCRPNIIFFVLKQPIVLHLCIKIGRYCHGKRCGGKTKHTFLLCRKWLSSIWTNSLRPPMTCPLRLLNFSIAVTQTLRNFLDILVRVAELPAMSSAIISICLMRSPCENLNKHKVNIDLNVFTVYCLQYAPNATIVYSHTCE